MTAAFSDLKLRVDPAALNDGPAKIDPLQADGWIVSSLLQKSIRRGEVEVAQRAALTLFIHKRSAIWRRLMVIAFEDIGVGAADALITTVTAGLDPIWRKSQGGDAGVAVGLARILAEAPKDRSADYLICGAKDHLSLMEARERCTATTTQGRLDAVADQTKSLAERAMWAWYASGIEWGSEKRVGKGALPALLELFECMGVPADLVGATKAAIARTREPITLMIPLIWLAVNDCPFSKPHPPENAW